MRPQDISKGLTGVLLFVRKHFGGPVFMALAMVVVFFAVYVLIMPAMTLDQDEARAQGGIDLPKAGQATEQAAQANPAEQADPEEQAKNSETGKGATADRSASEQTAGDAGNGAGEGRNTSGDGEDTDQSDPAAVQTGEIQQDEDALQPDYRIAIDTQETTSMRDLLTAMQLGENLQVADVDESIAIADDANESAATVDAIIENIAAVDAAGDSLQVSHQNENFLHEEDWKIKPTGALDENEEELLTISMQDGSSILVEVVQAGQYDINVVTYDHGGMLPAKPDNIYPIDGNYYLRVKIQKKQDADTADADAIWQDAGWTAIRLGSLHSECTQATVERYVPLDQPLGEETVLYYDPAVNRIDPADIALVQPTDDRWQENYQAATDSAYVNADAPARYEWMQGEAIPGGWQIQLKRAKDVEYAVRLAFEGAARAEDAPALDGTLYALVRLQKQTADGAQVTYGFEPVTDEMKHVADGSVVADVPISYWRTADGAVTGYTFTGNEEDITVQLVRVPTGVKNPVPGEYDGQTADGVLAVGDALSGDDAAGYAVVQYPVSREYPQRITKDNLEKRHAVYKYDVITLSSDAAQIARAKEAAEAADPKAGVASDNKTDAAADAAEDTRQVLTFEGDGYTVTAAYNADAGLPEETTLTAEEITTDDAAYQDWYDETLQVLQQSASGEKIEALTLAKFYDITFRAGDEEIEPAAPVDVTISYEKALDVSDADSLRIVHFDENAKGDVTPDLLDAGAVETSIDAKDRLTETTFTADRFSVYALAAAQAQASGSTTIQIHVTMEGQGTVILNNNTQNAYNSNAWSQYINMNAYSNNSWQWVPTTNAQAITAVASSQYGSKYIFDHWELNGQPLEYGSTIPAGALTIPAWATLKAVFKDEVATDAHGDIDTRLNNWKQDVMADNVSLDKTAQVSDELNRIYQVDLSASSGVRRPTQSIDITFVTDVSRSMFFPATLTEEGRFTQGTASANYNDSSLYNWLNTQADKSKVYYVVGDDSSATVTAVYYGGKAKNPSDSDYYLGWRAVDSAYFNAPDGNNQAHHIDIPASGGTIDPYSHNLTGVIYSAEGSEYRLYYLQKAVSAAADMVYDVDPGARIGLVTFAKTASTNNRFYTKAEKNALIQTLTTVTLQGGTNQQDGLEKATALIQGSEAWNGHKKYAVLVTDGAPNQDGVTWSSTIPTAATNLKNAVWGNPVTLYTLGLSLSMVPQENQNGMRNIASDPKDEHAFAAESGDDIVRMIEAIVESTLEESHLVGTVTDTIDGAFYPVTKDGTPLQDGDRINLSGEKISGTSATGTPYGTVRANADGTFSVEWTNQDVPGATRTSAETLPGWKGTIYVKAREDFLGGNTIKTNKGNGADTFTASKYRQGNSVLDLKDSNGTIKTVTGTYETPYVNVHELALDQNETEWTVYLGTEVNPAAQLQALLAQIKVSEVVSAADADNRRSADSKLASASGFKANTFPLQDLVGELTAEQWGTLVGGGTLTIPYTKYDDSRYGQDAVGSIVISLTKTGSGSAYAAHETGVTGSPAEKYTIKAVYQPAAVADAATYHTTSGGTAGSPTGNMTSNNLHKINVFAKDLTITKQDMSGNVLTDTAKFQLYRAVKDGETATDTITVKEDLKDKKLAVVAVGGELSTTGGHVTLPNLPYAPDGKYYLVETQAPDGYIILEAPMPIQMNLTDAYTDLAGEVKTAEELGLEASVATGALEATGEETATDGAQSAGEAASNASQQAETGKTAAYNWVQTVTLGYDNHETAPEKDGAYQVIVKNNPGAPLPNTGGPGTRGMMALGAVLLLGCSLILVRRRVRRV